MRGLNRRIWIMVLVLGMCYGVISWVRAGFSFEVIPLPRPLQEIPLTVDQWKGEDLPLDADVIRVLGAQETLNRVYQADDGSAVSLNISVWLASESVSTVAPHIPKLCYTNVGWNTLEEKQRKIKVGSGEIELTTLLFEKQGQRIVVAYWYQMGPDRFTTIGEARQVHRKLWGQKRWPATVKVLLQTTASSIDRGMPAIETFARVIEGHIFSSGTDGHAEGQASSPANPVGAP